MPFRFCFYAGGKLLILGFRLAFINGKHVSWVFVLWGARDEGSGPAGWVSFLRETQQRAGVFWETRGRPGGLGLRFVSAGLG